MPIYDSNNTDDDDNTTVVIKGQDNAYGADVIQESGLNKLLVKSSSIPEALGSLNFTYATNGGSRELNVNGSTTNVTFTIDADATRDNNINSLVFQAFASGIKINNFLSLNNELTNGIIIEVKSNDEIFTFRSIKNTMDFDSLFSFGDGRSFDLNFASGNDSMVARFGTTVPFTIKKQGTFTTDDYIKVIIKDNISSVTRLRFLAVGRYE